MSNKEKVYELYFIKRKKVVEIAKELGISQPAVTKILKQFPEYEVEKERRKKENKIKHNKQIAEYVKKRKQKLREQQREEEEALYAGMMELQRQNAVSMSKRRTLGTDTLVKLCITHYDYNKEKERLIFNESAGKRPADLPRWVYVHRNVLRQFRASTQ
ncbi:conserved hypothetical protein [Thermoanaerobacter italicus Ab9]|uniref:Uncharacterized protein n=1 Tax=Thermoanaerobacter italicus (strain DSM 9252 / Ab9) TaxID=580331 RepID=D3T5H2_THEIA|nr:terminase [Thermoanaerobacter italicus]ADD03345.1 conserved hypothetical protein [Thermoanaerobacter italicus Ab9]